MTFAVTAPRSHAAPTGARRLARLAGLALISWSRTDVRSWDERVLEREIARGAARLEAERVASTSGYVVR